ncbi:type VII secretion system-associated protein [Streptomyces sp. NPDC048636]|uniref:type VII secretion system-associated protein n=1 Tax=Streptomyces sp. NPDC048636 TaxID=3155762 RepID=UPI00343040EE
MAKEDPNSHTKKLSMDKAGLQSFLDDRVLPFKDEVRKIGEDDPSTGPSMATLIGDADITDKGFDSYDTGKPLGIGFMLQAENLGGKGEELNKAVGKTATDLTTLYEEQTKLFKDVEDNLRDTIDTLFKAQNDNLLSIDGQDFLDVFEDVDSDLSGGGAGGGKDKDDE